MPDMSRPYNVFDLNCPTRALLDRLADKWGLLILVRLERGVARFNQLRREVEGVSQKVLSQTLKKLERDGLITRRAYPTVPVTVEYALTDLGRTLCTTVAALTDWAERNMAHVRAAQAAYDGRGESAGLEQGADTRPQSRM